MRARIRPVNGGVTRSTAPTSRRAFASSAETMSSVWMASTRMTVGSSDCTPGEAGGETMSVRLAGLLMHPHDDRL